uniref:Uncharacterized protein n=1 Tax=Lotharella globosa TaxID=91324 RepID=A0A6V3IU75_9EUKA|mmetsp:Transcript_3581/g.6851  ORF Transcript_3581/g.6851 Transcript_3581/m.6851 type:complete len:102 (+) Transcript_3581:358-663(+)
MVPAENNKPRPVISELDATSGEAPKLLTSTTTMIIIKGAARQNANRFLRTIFLGSPDPIRKLDSPNEAGALCRIIASSSKASTEEFPETAAAPKGIPSIAA